MSTVKLFVEGGGSSKELHTRCRSAFAAFLEKSGLKSYMPRLIACGPRNAAYDDYWTAVKNGEEALLLIDSEAAVEAELCAAGAPATWSPWLHLKQRDNWMKPLNAAESDCHLMVQCMESWFLADIDVLAKYYGLGFSQNGLPGLPIESIPKKDIEAFLERATQRASKGSYEKGRDSFKILEKLDPQKVMAQSPWARRFVMLTKRKMGVAD